MKPLSVSALSRYDEPHFVPCSVTRWPGFSAKRCGMFCRHTWPLSSVMSHAFGTVSCSSVTVARISGGRGGDECSGEPAVSAAEAAPLADAGADDDTCGGGAAAAVVVAPAVGTEAVTGAAAGGRAAGIATAAEAAIAVAADVDGGEDAGGGALAATLGDGAASGTGRLAAFAAATWRS